MSNLRRSWRRWAKVIDTVILDEIRVDKVVFDNYRRILDDNPSIVKPATFHHWVLGNYGRTLAIQVRRLADGDSRSYSVRRLVGSIAQYHHLVTRKAYIRSYQPIHRALAAQTWVDYTDSSNPDVLPEAVCLRDLCTLKDAAKRVSDIVNRDIAHLDRRRRRRNLLYEEVFGILELQAALAAKYADLVGYRMAGTVCNGAYGEDWVRLFERPWITRGRGLGRRQKTTER